MRIMLTIGVKFYLFLNNCRIFTIYKFLLEAFNIKNNSLKLLQYIYSSL